MRKPLLLNARQTFRLDNQIIFLVSVVEAPPVSSTTKCGAVNRRLASHIFLTSGFVVNWRNPHFASPLMDGTARCTRGRRRL